MDLPNIPKGKVVDATTPIHGFTLEEICIIKSMVTTMHDWAKEHHASGEVSSEDAAPALVYSPRILFKCNIFIEFLKTK